MVHSFTTWATPNFSRTTLHNIHEIRIEDYITLLLATEHLYPCKLVRVFTVPFMGSNKCTKFNGKVNNVFSAGIVKSCRNYKTWTAHTCLWGSSILQPSWLINLVSTSLYIFENPRNSYTCSSFMYMIVLPNASSMQHLQGNIFRLLTISLSHYIIDTFNEPLHRTCTRLLAFSVGHYRECAPG